MNFENAERKLQHARFFLDQMAEQEGMAFDDKRGALRVFLATY